MGYCYDRASGKLVCDKCSSHGGVRKRHCPSGYCQPLALCSRCNKAIRTTGLPVYKDGNPTGALRTWAEMHEGCAAGHAKYEAELKARPDYVAPATIVVGKTVEFNERLFRVSRARGRSWIMTDAAGKLFRFGPGILPMVYEPGAVAAMKARVGAVPTKEVSMAEFLSDPAIAAAVAYANSMATS